MDKFNKYLKNKSKSENKEFVLPNSFECKLEETLKNLDKENKTNVLYINKKLWTMVACFAFVFLVGISIKYGVNSNKSNFIDRSLENQIAGYSDGIPEVASRNKAETRDVVSDEVIDSNNINKIIIKNIVDGNIYKSIDNKIDIERIISFINDIPKEEIQEQILEEWEFLIQTNGMESNHTIIIKNHIMNIDNKWYKIDSKEVNSFKNMYNDLNYDENSIP